MRRRLKAFLLWAVLLCAHHVQAKSAPPLAQPQEALQQAVTLFQAKNYAQAIPLLRIAQGDSELRNEVTLLLGICLYRTGELSRAETLLRESEQSPDKETKEAAQLFLGLLYDELGATDKAQDQLGKTTSSQAFGSSAQRLLLQRRPHRLLFSLLVAPELDGNVRLTDTATWRNAPTDAADADILFLASLGIRPFRFGLSAGNVVSYRQQIQLRDYSLLLNSTWLGYSYAGARNRVRVHTAFDFALLGGSKLFMDFDGRLYDRLSLWSQLGVAASYGFRYRKYASTDYQSLSGQTHVGQVDLSWGVTPEPLLLSVAYQLVREQLEAPLAPLTVSEDYRAWAHGPSLRARIKLHHRVEWSLAAQYLRRVFDYVPGPELPTELGQARKDHFLSVDTSLAIRFGGHFESFVGGSLVSNQSSYVDYSYLKPSAYLGIAVYFGVL